MCLNKKIKSLVMIPGSGEFVYSTTMVYDYKGRPLNAINEINEPNIILTVKQLKQDFPELKNISLVVGWFANAPEAKDIKIIPKVESKSPVKGEDWKVAKYARNTAEPVLQINDIPNWGSTPSDKSIIEACELLYSNGYNVTLYPMLYVDSPGKPWRGNIKANSLSEIKHFFNQYNKFILHYASLERQGKRITDYIDKFIIGSEFKELLKYQDDQGNFKAVDKMIDLASKVKSLVGKKVEFTYAVSCPRIIAP